MRHLVAITLAAIVVLSACAWMLTDVARARQGLLHQVARAQSDAARTRTPNYRQRLKALRLPGPKQVRVDYSPSPYGKGREGAGAADGIVFDPGHTLDRHDLAHESFHLLDQQSLTDQNRARLQRIMGKHAAPGEWIQGFENENPRGKPSPDEIAAEWFAAARRRIDPRKGWESGYTDDVPTRRDLMRFAHAMQQIGKRAGLPAYRRPR